MDFPALLTLLAVGSCLAAGPSAAAIAGQNDVTEPADVLEELVVTGTREPKRRADAAESTGVIGGAEIAAIKPLNASDILERIPGVHITDLGGDHHGTSIRHPISFNPVYLFLENGVPTRSTGFFNVNTLIEMNVPQAAAIEVTKGPGTALYGSDAVGGVVNLLTGEPAEEPEATASLEAGAFGWARGLFSVSTEVGDQRFRADVNITHSDGWRDDSAYDRQLGTLTWMSGRDGGWRAKTILSGGLVDQQSSGSNLTVADFLGAPRVNYVPTALRKIKTLRLYSIIERDAGDALISLTPYFRYNAMTLMPAFSVAFDPHVENTSNASVGAQLKYRRDMPGLQWIVGLDVDYSPGQRRDLEVAFDRVGELFTDQRVTGRVLYDYDATFMSISPYVHVEVRLGERLGFSAGLRADYIRYVYRNHLDVVDDPAALFKRPASTDVDFDQLSPKVGLTYDFSDRFNGYLAYRRAFRAPTSSQLFRPGRSLASVDLDPVKAANLELGLRANPSPRIGFEVTVYRLLKRDDILAFTDTATSARTNLNAGKTLHRGIEAGLRLTLTQTISLAASYAYNRHIFRDWQPDTDTDFTGNRLQRAPKDNANVRLILAPAFLGGGRAEIEWVHLGSYFEDDENTRKYGGHDLVNIRANLWLTDRVELRARLQNLTNKRYAVLARFTRFRGERLKPGLPRSFYAGFAVRF